MNRPALAALATGLLAIPAASAPAPQGAVDPRFFGDYYGAQQLTLKKGSKSKTVQVDDIRLHLHHLPGDASFVGGYGVGTVKGEQKSFSLAGHVVAEGVLTGTLRYWNDGEQIFGGTSFLSGDGDVLTTFAMGNAIVLRKDVPGPNGAVNAKPQLSIQSPSQGQTLTWGSLPPFQAAVVDDAPGPAEWIRWSSSLSGAFPQRGASVQPPFLDPGQHTITCWTIDAGGRVAAQEVDIQVENEAPNAPKILQPEDGDVVVAGGPFQCFGKAWDGVEGWIVDQALTWSSDQEGALGNWAFAVPTLTTLGPHTITLTATDEWGGTSSLSVTVNVVPSQGNTPPRCTILLPHYAASTPQVFVPGLPAMAPSVPDHLVAGGGQSMVFVGEHPKDSESPPEEITHEWRLADITAGKSGAVEAVVPPKQSSQVVKIEIYGHQGPPPGQWPQPEEPGPRCTVTFPDPPTPRLYRVSLVATDGGGMQGRASRYVWVMPTKPMSLVTKSSLAKIVVPKGLKLFEKP